MIHIIQIIHFKGTYKNVYINISRSKREHISVLSVSRRLGGTLQTPFDEFRVIARVIIRLHLHDIVGRAGKEGHALVHALGLQVHNPGLARQRQTPSLLDEEGHRGSWCSASFCVSICTLVPVKPVK